jgi:hypothetical protein
LIEGLATETVVTDAAGMALFKGIERIPLRAALRTAIGDYNVR